MFANSTNLIKYKFKMFKATRELIKARQPHTKYVLEVVIVKQLGSGLPNKCFQNATDDKLLALGNKVVSGWVVATFDSHRQSTAIVQHWWNIDENGVYFDTTPNIEQNYEYVIDTELCDFGQQNIDNLDNLVSTSLLYQHGIFYGVENQNGSLVTKPLTSLSTANLFSLP